MSEQQEALDLSALRGQVAVVTGAGNRGVGWGLCQYAAGELGMHVVAADLHDSLVEKAQLELREAFPRVESLGIRCDVTDPASLDACLDTIRREMPGVPIGAVFPNAGVVFPHTILKSTVEEWSTTLNVNVIGVVNTIKVFLPALQAQETPSVICPTASVGGLIRGDGGGAAYQASKHAVVALTESLSFELARRHPQIHVHVLCPCIVRSALVATSKANQAHDGREPFASSEEPELLATDLAMTPERHAQQVFDQIAEGKFYVVTDNVKPYVDHDFPFNGMERIRERVDNLLRQTIDNRDAFSEDKTSLPSASLKGPFFDELRRRLKEDQA